MLLFTEFYWWALTSIFNTTRTTRQFSVLQVEAHKSFFAGRCIDVAKWRIAPFCTEKRGGGGNFESYKLKIHIWRIIKHTIMLHMDEAEKKIHSVWSFQLTKLCNDNIYKHPHALQIQVSFKPQPKLTVHCMCPEFYKVWICKNFKNSPSELYMATHG